VRIRAVDTDDEHRIVGGVGEVLAIGAIATPVTAEFGLKIFGVPPARFAITMLCTYGVSRWIYANSLCVSATGSTVPEPEPEPDEPEPNPDPEPGPSSLSNGRSDTRGHQHHHQQGHSLRIDLEGPAALRHRDIFATDSCWLVVLERTAHLHASATREHDRGEIRYSANEEVPSDRSDGDHRRG
jgi:hypothetical protein